MTNLINLHLDKDYIQFLGQLKARLHNAQMRASLAVNTEQIHFYWETGKSILEKQKTKKWGSKFLEQISHDLQTAFPEMQGFSISNLKRMKRFAELYPDFAIGAQPVRQLPWGHIVLLIQKVNENTERDWYAGKAVEHGWSRSVLTMQIESYLYERQAKNDNKITNFHKFLPKSQSDLARDMLKDPYKFDFLTIQGKTHEKAIESGLIAHIRDFLLELGQGFAFVGSQVPLNFDDQEFFVDLLFYHLNLRCYVVCELKATKFKPEHTGQLGFYLAAIDDQLKKEHDNRTIGILLCKTKNKVVAEYALQNIDAPIGVSEYTLTKAVPKNLKTDLPTIEEIETELSKFNQTCSRK
jgi:predicted nuclease of restriction endonuclease-like (RecB) superfamily